MNFFWLFCKNSSLNLVLFCNFSDGLNFRFWAETLYLLAYFDALRLFQAIFNFFKWPVHRLILLTVFCFFYIRFLDNLFFLFVIQWLINVCDDFGTTLYCARLRICCGNSHLVLDGLQDTETIFHRVFFLFFLNDSWSYSCIRFSRILTGDNFFRDLGHLFAHFGLQNWLSCFQLLVFRVIPQGLLVVF